MASLHSACVDCRKTWNEILRIGVTQTASGLSLSRHTDRQRRLRNASHLPFLLPPPSLPLSTTMSTSQAQAQPTPTQSTSTPFLPDWLERACRDPEYQRHVYSELADREREREAARRASRGGGSGGRASSRRRTLFSAFAGLGMGMGSSSSPTPSSPTTSSTTTQAAPHGGHYDVKIGTSDTNMAENRYNDIAPFDRTRVTVSVDGHPEGRYLNASWVRELWGGCWWVAAQAPLPNTAHAFLGLFVQG